MRSEFSAVRRRILLQVALIVLVAGGVGWLIQYILIDGFLQEWFIDVFTGICVNLLNMSYRTAENLYIGIFRGQKTMWMALGFIVLLTAAFYVGLTRFMRYFKQIGDAVHALADEKDEPIELPSELEFLEKRIESVRRTLLLREKNAREAEQRKNDLVVYLAHDIKTPLTSVVGYLSLLSEAPDTPIEQRARYIDLTLEKAYRLEQLIGEFFDITRFNLQSIELNWDEMDLNMMLMQIADEFYPALKARDMHAEVKIEKQIFLIGDADKLARVLNNIMKNALAYGDPGTPIAIAARTKDNRVAISIANRGRKIPEAKLNQIFEKFYRLDEARSTNAGGAGLGLAIAKEIVLAHGGDIRARSDEEKTVFTVLLPLDASKTQETKPTSKPAEPTKTQRVKKPRTREKTHASRS